ncbi:MAG: hypothetical protein ABH865_04365 [Candidatus Omnitrophota bacterium]
MLFCFEETEKHLLIKKSPSISKTLLTKGLHCTYKLKSLNAKHIEASLPSL